MATSDKIKEVPTASHGGQGFFTAAQNQAIETADRDLLVLAGAGTGKTTILVEKAIRLNTKYGAGSIAVITFTKKAAGELKTRIAARLAAEGIERRDDPMVGTFHTVATTILQRAVQRGILEARPKLADDRDQTHYAATVLAEGNIEHGRVSAGDGRRRGADQGARALLNTIEKIKRNGWLPVEDGYLHTNGSLQAQVAGLPATGSRLHRDTLRYQELMNSQAHCDYADLILLATRLLIAHRQTLIPEVIAILVDEYQDVDEAQDRFVHALAGGHHITCVGDDDQCIYAWRGARVENLLSFEATHPGSTTITLDVNHRCPSDILKHASLLVARNATSEVRIDKAITSPSTLEADNSVTVHDLHLKHPSTRRSTLEQLRLDDIPHYVAGLISRLVETGARYADIAFLARTNNEVEKLERILDSRDIPVRIANPNGVTSTEARRLTAWLRAIAEPDEIAAAAAVTTMGPGNRTFNDIVLRARHDKTPIMARLAELAAEGRLRRSGLTGGSAISSQSARTRLVGSFARNDGGRPCPPRRPLLRGRLPTRP